MHSPYADYLLYRDTSRAPGLAAVPLGGVPTLGTLVAPPELAASADVRAYRDLAPLVELYRGVTTRTVATPAPRLLTYGRRPADYHSLRTIVARGAAGFSAFRALWARALEPEERRNIARVLDAPKLRPRLGRRR